MKIIKFLDKKYKKKLTKEGFIRIGSFNYYKNSENENIKDENEWGSAIVYKDKTIITEEHNSLFFNDGIWLQNDWLIDTWGCPLIWQPGVFNTLIFCCSKINHNSNINKIKNRLKYNSFYEIIDSDLFSGIISKKLFDYFIWYLMDNPWLISNNFNNPLFNNPELYLRSILRLKCIHREVTYTNEPKHRVIWEDELDNFNPKLVNLYDFFIKKEIFSKEQEYRFVWILFLDINWIIDIISIPDIFLDINEKEILKTIKS